jgi:hypothetical protein
LALALALAFERFSPQARPNKNKRAMLPVAQGACACRRARLRATPDFRVSDFRILGSSFQVVEFCFRLLAVLETSENGKPQIKGVGICVVSGQTQKNQHSQIFQGKKTTTHKHFSVGNFLTWLH